MRLPPTELIEIDHIQYLKIKVLWVTVLARRLNKPPASISGDGRKCPWLEITIERHGQSIKARLPARFIRDLYYLVYPEDQP